VSGPQGPASPAPRQVEEVRVELQRVVRRWRQLPLDHALSYAGRVRALVQSLADEVAAGDGLEPLPVPDCGPATLMDQLTVMVYDVLVHVSMHDAVQEGPMQDGPRQDTRTTLAPASRTETLAGQLASLRRQLS
jgi:hypothetical protein